MLDSLQDLFYARAQFVLDKNGGKLAEFKISRGDDPRGNTEL